MAGDANSAPVLTSFGGGFKTLIFGATGAIGGALIDAVREQKNAGVIVTTARSISRLAAADTQFACDLAYEASIADVAWHLQACERTTLAPLNGEQNPYVASRDDNKDSNAE